MDLNVSPQNSQVIALTPNVTVFEHRVFKEVIKVKWSGKDKALTH